MLIIATNGCERKIWTGQDTQHNFSFIQQSQCYGILISSNKPTAESAIYHGRFISILNRYRKQVSKWIKENVWQKNNESKTKKQWIKDKNYKLILTSCTLPNKISANYNNCQPTVDLMIQTIHFLILYSRIILHKINYIWNHLVT